MRARMWDGFQACADQYVGDQGFQGTHLGSTGDRAAGSGVNLSSLNLLLPLTVTGIPEGLHRFLETPAQAFYHDSAAARSAIP